MSIAKVLPGNQSLTTLNIGTFVGEITQDVRVLQDHR